MSPCGRWMIYCRGGALIKAMRLVLLHDVKPLENVPVHLHIHEGSLTTRVLSMIWMAPRGRPTWSIQAATWNQSKFAGHRNPSLPVWAGNPTAPRGIDGRFGASSLHKSIQAGTTPCHANATTSSTFLTDSWVELGLRLLDTVIHPSQGSSEQTTNKKGKPRSEQENTSHSILWTRSSRFAMLYSSSRRLAN